MALGCNLANCAELNFLICRRGVLNYASKALQQGTDRLSLEKGLYKEVSVGHIDVSCLHYGNEAACSPHSVFIDPAHAHATG